MRFALLLIALVACSETEQSPTIDDACKPLSAFQKQGAPMTMYFDDDVGDFEAGFDSGALIEKQGYESGALIPDTFDAEVEEIRRGRDGMAKLTPLNSEWIQLTRGKTIGKKVNIFLDGPNGVFDGTINLLEIVGPSDAAMPLCLTLLPPQKIYGVTQNLPGGTGERNVDVPGGASNIDGTNTALTATIEWGIGGVQASAEVDFVNGAQVNLRASFVRVSVNGRLFSTVAVELLTASAFVGPGYGNPMPAQKTSFNLNAAGFIIGALNPLSTTDFIPIPRFAKNVRFVGGFASGVAPDLQIDFFNQTLPAPVFQSRYEINVAGIAAGGPRLSDPLPIRQGNYFITVRNLSGSAIATPSLVFDLSL